MAAQVGAGLMQLAWICILARAAVVPWLCKNHGGKDVSSANYTTGAERLA